jgi:beta-lactamase superfamily II metal-dependent hydrolase
VKKLVENSILLSFLIFFFLLAEDRFPASATVCVMALWILKTKDHSWLYVLILLLYLMIPYGSTASASTVQEGNVILSRENYAVIQTDSERLLLYTKEMPVLDSRIRMQGSIAEWQSPHGFFRFDFARSCRLRGIRRCFKADSVATVLETRSARGLLQKHICSMGSERRRSSIRKILYGGSPDLDLKSFLQDASVSAVGILYLADFLLRWIADEKMQKKISFGITLLAACFWRFPLLLSFRLAGMLLKRLQLPRSMRLGLQLSIILVLYPYAVLNAGFLMAAGYRLCGCFSREPEHDARLFSMMMQSCLFNAVNPIQVCLYRFLLPLMGVLHLTALAAVFFPWIPVEQVLLLTDQMLSCLNWFVLPGTMLGFGLPFFAALCISYVRCRRVRCRGRILVLFLIFQMLGWFHPLAEITFLNVGQGDSILIRAPFNRENILIDTGRPSQQQTLRNLLQAKGIRRLKTFITTHADSDHDGSREMIQEVYRPEFYSHAHHPPLGKQIQLTDINAIANENENQSSVVDVFHMNGLNVLCMGDADRITEEQISEKYSRLSCDILKLSHHGSKTGSCARFLDTVQPRLAVISCGDYSIYHHPSAETIQRLLERHIPYLSTHDDGDISIFCLPGWNLLLTSTGKIAIIKA